jgi:inhibitor of cysteine peptidase
VTSDWNNGARTNVFSIGRNGVIRDAIINVAPRESFQSSRTIGSKLYLVTFEQTDPLFVINIGNPDKLTILGELVIP